MNESPFTDVSIAVIVDCYLFGDFCEHLKYFMHLNSH